MVVVLDPVVEVAVDVGAGVELEVPGGLDPSSGLMTLSSTWMRPLLVSTLGEMSLASLK